MKRLKSKFKNCAGTEFARPHEKRIRRLFARDSVYPVFRMELFYDLYLYYKN